MADKNHKDGDKNLTPRTVRAREMDDKDVPIHHVRDGVYHVGSASSDKTYTVVPSARYCSCPDHTARDTVCKHLRYTDIKMDVGDEMDEAVDEAVKALVQQIEALTEWAGDKARME